MLRAMYALQLHAMLCRTNRRAWQMGRRPVEIAVGEEDLDHSSTDVQSPPSQSRPCTAVRLAESSRVSAGVRSVLRRPDGVTAYR